MESWSPSYIGADKQEINFTQDITSMGLKLIILLTIVITMTQIWQILHASGEINWLIK